MLEVFINTSEIVGAAIFRLLPKSLQRNIDPDSTLGQALGLVLGVTLLIGVAVLIYKVR
jgi:hypothetical protein